MISRNNPLIAPEDLYKKYLRAEQESSYLLKVGSFEGAARIWEDLYQDYLKAQNYFGFRLHKGGIFHNIGIAYIFLNNYENAFKNFVLAYAEDSALNIEDLGGDPKKGPAGQTLQDAFGVGDEVFVPVYMQVENHLEASSYADPRKIFKDFLALKLGEKATKDEVKTRSNAPLVRKRKLGISEVPGKWEERVFVGGSYHKTRIGDLFKIKDFVTENNLIPVFVGDFADHPELTPRRKSLILLHACKYAIFDITSLTGQLIEMERAADYEVETLLVYRKENDSMNRITTMITGLLSKPKEFTDIKQLEKLVKDFLS